MEDRKLVINFIRHGTTKANDEGRFLGWGDEPITDKGRAELEALKAKYTYPTVEKVFRSPATRCRETAAIFFPGVPEEEIEGLWEVGFGEKEGMFASEMAGTPKMLRWSRMEPDFIMDEKLAESILEARFRVMGAVTNIVKKCRYEGLHEVAVVFHGAIMCVLMLEALSPDEAAKAFRLSPNGMGIAVEVDMEGWWRRPKFEMIDYLPVGAERPAGSPFYEEG
ncbi:MAG: histidine phosphatase family protein [Lachnospiraceae bacterium]|nr:histidine phosphatase family protein [Lachnospiraceae bacterium]